MSEGNSRYAFNGFLLYFAVPALLFRFASTAAFAEIMNGRFFIAYTVGSLVTLALVVAFARGVMGARLRDASFYGLAASATNIGYLAIPLLVALLGASAASPAMLATVCEMTIVASVAVALYRPGATQGLPLIALPVVGKLLLHPFAVWLALLAFGVDRLTVTAGVLTAALPTAGWVFIFAQRYESDVARISTALVASTALSAATFSALVWHLGLGMGAK